jgi:hypothetical protein
MKTAIRQIGVLFLLVLCVYGAPKPAPAPARWLGLIGEYGPDSDILYILEKDGKLSASFKRADAEPTRADVQSASNSTRQRSRAARLNPKAAPTSYASNPFDRSPNYSRKHSPLNHQWKTASFSSLISSS